MMKLKALAFTIKEKLAMEQFYWEILWFIDRSLCSFIEVELIK